MISIGKTVNNPPIAIPITLPIKIGCGFHRSLAIPNGKQANTPENEYDEGFVWRNHAFFI
jgi:hypothetical protein